MNIYVVYQVKYGRSDWWTKDPTPVAAFTSLKEANRCKRDRDSRARGYWYRVRRLELQYSEED